MEGNMVERKSCMFPTGSWSIHRSIFSRLLFSLVSFLTYFHCCFIVMQQESELM